MKKVRLPLSCLRGFFAECVSEKSRTNHSFNNVNCSKERKTWVKAVNSHEHVQTKSIISKFKTKIKDKKTNSRF
jgi:hypothetical protein